MKNVPLRESSNVTLDSSGNGFARVGPISSREIWHPQNAHISANTNPTNEAICTIYVGRDISQPNFRDISYSGSSGDTSGRIDSDTIYVGQYVYAQWANGDPGALATLTVTG